MRWITATFIAIVPALAFGEEKASMKPALAYNQVSVSFLMLLLLLSLVIFFIWYSRKKLPGAKTGGLVDVLSSSSIGLKERIVLVKVNQSYLLLGITPHSVNLLKEFESIPEGMKLQPKPGVFSEVLSQYFNRGSK